MKPPRASMQHERARLGVQRAEGLVEQEDLGLVGQCARERGALLIEEAVFMANRVLVMTARPARIKAVVDTTLPRPRHYTVKTTPEFAALEARLTDELRVESIRAPEMETR